MDKNRVAALPAGPRFPLLAALHYLRDPPDFYTRCAAQYGDRFTLPTPAGPLVVLGAAADLRRFFALPPGDFTRFAPETVVPLLGARSLLVVSGEQHRRDRQRVAPLFAAERVRALGHTMRAATLDELNRLPARSTLRMQDLAPRIALEIIVRGAPSPAALRAAPYLDAVCNESLRIYPVVPEVIRKLVRPLALPGLTIPAGVAVAVCIARIHHQPDVYQSPERFQPERFLGGRRYAPHEYLPYAAGVRRCLGATLAADELKIMLGTLLARCQLKLRDRSPERPTMRHLAMGPRGGVPIVLTKYAGAPV